MKSFPNILTEFLAELSKAKDEYEICLIFGNTLQKSELIESFEVFLLDSQGNKHCIVSKGQRIVGEHGSIMLNHGDHVYGEIRYSPLDNDAESIQLLSILNAITSLALHAVSHQHDAFNSHRLSGRTSLLMNSVLEMLSIIIMQDTSQGIGRMAGQFLMGQLMIGMYAIMIQKKDGSREIISSNGITDSESHELLSAIACDNELSMHGDFTSVSMMHGGNVHGAIILKNQPASRKLSEDDVFFISVLGMIIAVSLEKARLQEESKELAQLQREMEIAGIVQSKLFPSFEQKYPNCSISGMHIPSLDIGGDYMDVIPYPDGSLALIIADVSGKGIASAMIMAMVKSACILLVKQMKSPEDIIREINAMIYEQTSADIFVTFVCIALSADRKKIIAINAGHEAPLLRTSKGEVIPLRKGCMVLGVMNDLPHIETETLSIHPDDILCMYTDGLFDSSMQEELTLHEILSKNQFISAHEFMENIEKTISNQNEKYASDDKTLLLISIT